MSKTLSIIFAFLFVVSVRAEEQPQVNKPYVTNDLLSDITKAAAELKDADQEVINGLGLTMINQVYRSVVGSAYTALTKGRSKGFLEALTPKMAEAFKTPEAQEELRKSYSQESVSGYSDAGKVVAILIARGDDGVPQAQIQYHYLMAKSEADTIDFVAKVDVPFVAGAKVEGGSLEALLATLISLDIDKAKISDWKKKSTKEESKTETKVEVKTEEIKATKKSNLEMHEPSVEKIDDTILRIKKQKEQEEIYRLIREGRYI